MGGKKNCVRPTSREIQARMFSRRVTRSEKGRSASDIMNLEGDEVVAMVVGCRARLYGRMGVATTNVGQKVLLWTKCRRE